MRPYRVLLSLLLGLRPRAHHRSACVRLGDLSGVAQINLVLKTVSYYPQPKEWREPPGWWTLSEGTSRVFRSTLQGYESIDCRPLNVIWDYLPDWPWYPLWWNCVKIITLINCLYIFGCNSCLSRNDYSIRRCAKILKVRIHYLAAFWQTKPTSQKPCMIRGKVFLLDG
jgi:hypothetical protein